MSAINDVMGNGIRKESDSLGEVEVPVARLWARRRDRAAKVFEFLLAV